MKSRSKKTPEKGEGDRLKSREKVFEKVDNEADKQTTEVTVPHSAPSQPVTLGL